MSPFVGVELCLLDAFSMMVMNVWVFCVMELCIRSGCWPKRPFSREGTVIRGTLAFFVARVGVLRELVDIHTKERAGGGSILVSVATMNSLLEMLLCLFEFEWSMFFRRRFSVDGSSMRVRLALRFV